VFFNTCVAGIGEGNMMCIYIVYWNSYDVFNTRNSFASFLTFPPRIRCPCEQSTPSPFKGRGSREGGVVTVTSRYTKTQRMKSNTQSYQQPQPRVTQSHSIFNSNKQYILYQRPHLISLPQPHHLRIKGEGHIHLALLLPWRRRRRRRGFICE